MNEERGLDIELLGRVRLTREGRPLPSQPSERLLVLLLLERGQPMARDQLAYSLWPDSSDAQALTNLRRELHGLRRATADLDGPLAITRRTVEWAPAGGYRLDVALFEAEAAAAAAGDAEAAVRAVELYRGDLAPTIYDDWIVAPREQLRATYRATLGRLVAHLEERREYRAALEHARRIVAFDPLDEDGCRAQMRLAMLLGDRSTGLRAYHACVSVLRRELGVDPAPETQAAYEALLAAPPRPTVPAEGSAPSARVDAVAVPHQLIGRRLELDALLTATRRRADGRPSLQAVRGDPGIGKTRLIEELARRWVADGGRVASTRSYAAEGSLAYAPVAAWMRSTSVWAGLVTLEPVWLTELARLAPELLETRSDLAAPVPMTEGWQRLRLFEALVRAIRATPGPLLLVLDDAHWSDADSLEWIHFLWRADPAPDVVVVLGIRVEEERSNAALAGLLDSLDALDELYRVDLGPLGEDDAARLAASCSGLSLDGPMRRRLHRDTGGNPLFVVEVARSGLPVGAPGERQDDPAGMPLPGMAMPPRMRAVIAGRLERVSPEARPLAEIAATIGRDFTVELLAEAGDADEETVTRAVDELWRRQIIREGTQGGYDFCHDRIRDVLEGLVAPGRRRLLHRRVARAIERLGAQDLDTVAAQLAAHYEAAGMAEEAIGFHERAAASAARLSANREAARHLSRALALVRGLPRSADRDRREMALQLNIAAPLNATVGYASRELQAALDRAFELAQLLSDRERAILALNGLYHVHFVRGSIRRSIALAETALALTGDDPRYLSIGHLAVAGPLASFGEIDRSVDAFARAIGSYDPAISRPSTFGLDPLVFAEAWSAHALWLRGRASDARAASAAAITRAQDLERPFLQALAFAYSAVRCQMASDLDLLVEHARAAVDLCERHRFPYYGEWATILLAWVDRARTDGAARIEAALDSLRRIDAHSRWPYYLALLADVHTAAGRPAAATAVLDAATATAVANDDRWWLPEVHRMLGAGGTGATADEHLDTALRMAVGQGSFALGVRAAASIVRRQSDRRAEVVAVVSAIADGREDEPADLAVRRQEEEPDR